MANKHKIVDMVLRNAVFSSKDVVTKEMEDFFNKRTNNHIALVQKYCQQIEDAHPEFKGLIERGKVHDQSKFEEPEKTPYIFITWKYKMKEKDGEDFQISDDMDKRMNLATNHHIKNELNKHHPEASCDKEVNLINRKDRDKPPEEMIDATKMTDMNIAEMSADWLAMAEERGNTAKNWADKNVNVRWKFSPEQKNLIYSLIE